MPTKQTAKQKQQVKQVVNVRIGDTARAKAKRRRRAAAPRGGGGVPASGLAQFNRTPTIITSLSTMAAPMQQPNYIAEYNSLLAAMAAEKRAREAAAQPLQPNTAPLTMNMQRNELLSRQTPRTPIDPITERFSQLATKTVEQETYDDPMTNENMLTTPPSLAYNIAPKLPIQMPVFDEEDVVRFDEEDEAEQAAIVKQVSSSGKTIDIVRTNITEAFKELGIKPAEKKRILQSVLGNDYIEGKAPTRYKLNDLEKILGYLRSEIRQKNPKQKGEEIYATTGIR